LKDLIRQFRLIPVEKFGTGADKFDLWQLQQRSDGAMLVK